MGKYRLKYASVGGSITGKVPGDEVTVTGDEEQQLKDLGLIESEEDYQARQEAKAQADAKSEPEEPDGDELEQLRQKTADLKQELDSLSKSSQENSAHLNQALEEARKQLERTKESAASLAEAHQKLEAEHRAFQDLVLSPYAGKGGWYAFPTGDEGEDFKVRGRDAALDELAKRLNAEGGDDAESGGTADGQQPQA